MQISKSTQALIEAVNASLWAREVKYSKFENLTDQEWHTIFYMSFHQTVEGLVAAAIQKLPVDLLPPIDLRLKWLVRLTRIQEANQKMGADIITQYTHYKNAGIRCVLHKGHSVSQYYPDPALRVVGDVDWLFPTEDDYSRALDLVITKGGKLESRDRISCGFNWKDCSVEHHRQIIQLYNPMAQKKSTKFVNGQLEVRSFMKLGNLEIEVPNPYLNIVQVNAHIFKHQIGYGIGLRQLCDSFLLYKAYLEQIDHSELLNVYKEFGMLKWSHFLHQMLVDFFDMPLENLPYPLEKQNDIDWMKNYILKSGNFGFYDKDNPDTTTPGGRVNRSKRLFRNFFHFVRISPMEAICFPFSQVYKKSFI